MQVPVSWIKAVVVAVVVAWAGGLFLLWQPVRQVELHTRHLLERAADRDWPAVQAMLAPDYRDAWGHGKEQALADAEEFGRHFFSLRIGPLEALTVQKDSVSVRLGVYGSGTPLAQAIIEAVHELEKPFVFRWRKNGTWPWQWVLAEVEQEELAARYPR